MKISTRVFLGFGLVITLMAGMAVLNYRSAMRSRSDVQTFRNQSALLSSIHTLDHEVLDLQRNALIFASTGHPAKAVRVRELDARVTAILAEIGGRVHVERQRDLHQKLGELRAAYREAFERLREDRERRDELFREWRQTSRSISASLERLGSEDKDLLRAVEAFFSADHAMMSYVESPDSSIVRRAQGHLKRAVETLEATGRGPMTEDVLEYEATFLQMVQAIRGYLFLANVVLAGQAAEFTHNTRSFRKQFGGELASVLEGLEEDSRRSSIASMSFAVVTLVLGFLASWAVGRSIAGPIGRMTNTFARLARGEKVENIPGLDQRDEIGEMANAAQIFKERNQQTEELLQLSRERGRQLQVQAKELERANGELEQFAYVASHDLQEPLRMVASYVQLLGMEYEGKLDADADEYIGFASEGAKRMQELINDLLELSRVGRTEAEVQDVDAGALLESVCKDLEQPLLEVGADVRVGRLPTLPAFPNQLRQVFQNFVGNAIKYRSTMDVPVLRIGAEESDSGWVFCFEDNGIGIDPAHSERIFKIFQRLHSRTEYEGSGMGLAIVKKIAEQHNGRVWVESEPGLGSRFHFLVGRLAA